VFRSKQLFQQTQTRDQALALLFHSDEIDTAKNQLGSHSGRTILVASFVIANGFSTRTTSPSQVFTFLLASKEVVKQYGRERIFRSTVEELLILRQGMYSNFAYSQLTVWTGIATSIGTVFADIVAWVGDNKEQNLVGGWRGTAVCRHCHLQLNDPDAPSSAALRTSREHEEMIQRMELEGSDIGHRAGINGRSFLCELPDFDVIYQITQDHVMHDELEGVDQIP